jgi:DNA repair exonuclease SbcCD ATPase subunit
MIPLRILLQGFLCYRDKTEIGFDDSSLWMLAGLNGSGKSAVFDAVTYALFGGHRGGKQNAEELINKESDGLVVELDFLRGNAVYRIKRTLKKSGRSTRQVLCQVEAEGKKVWQPVESTNNQTGFAKWVSDNIGLNYDTFTSSVLLMQGRAEKLLNSDASERRKVLAGIVDLERYEKLHKRADEERKRFRDRAEELKQRLELLAEVGEEELQQAEVRITEAEGRLEAARAAVEGRQRLKVLGERWADLRTKLAKAEEQWQRAKALLAEADSIRRHWERLRELRQILPHLETVLNQRQRLEQSTRGSEALLAKRQTLKDCIEELDSAVRQTGQKQQALEADRDALAERKTTVATRLQALSAALPLLNQLHRQREQLRGARKKSAEAVEKEREAGALVRRLEEAYAPLAAEREAAAKALQDARDQMTRTRTLLDEVRERAKRFHSVVGEKMCRYCGQPLTPSHVHEEKVKLEKEQATAEQNSRQAEQVQKDAAREEKRRGDRQKVAEQQLTAARQQVTNWHREHENAERDAVGQSEECGRAYQELEEPFRLQVSPAPPEDWLPTSFPTATDLDGLKKQYAEFKTDDGSLDKDLRSRREQVAAEQQEEKRLTRERERVRTQLANLDQKLAEEKALRQGYQEVLDRARAALPADWQAEADTLTADRLRDLADEQADLERQGAEARAQELQQARERLEPLRHEKEERQRDLDAVPEEARREPAELEELLRAAVGEQKQRDLELSEARNARGELTWRRQQRAELQQQSLDADQQHNRYKLLAELLGPKRLQLHLVRQAEQGIVDYGNEVLDRLSGGQLFLSLRREEGEEVTDKALDLEAYNRTAGDAPIGVAFLSGSQRFRVAVSLALGIGQYASHQHRPIESVIIDEGFGCLDRHGRQVMIQELQNLRDHMRCILLVSHQDEFAEAFANGYRFELTNGSTQVTRFQR